MRLMAHPFYCRHEQESRFVWSEPQGIHVGYIEPGTTIVRRASWQTDTDPSRFLLIERADRSRYWLHLDGTQGPADDDSLISTGMGRI